MLNSFIGLSNRSKRYTTAGQKMWRNKRPCNRVRTDFWIQNSRLSTILQTFSRSRKLLGKFQDFFKSSRLCTNPDVKGCPPGDMNRHCSVEIECNLGYWFLHWLKPVLICMLVVMDLPIKRKWEKRMETNKHEGIGLNTIKRREWKEIERIGMEWLEVE